MSDYPSLKNKELSLNEIRILETNILKEFGLFCKKHGLKYTLAGGSLLGAVRHRGFIPWDDDIDVAMNRDDYNKLLSLYNNDGHYKLISIYNNDKYGFLFARIYDDRTYVDEKNVNRLGANYGIFIDIFPIDCFGNTHQDALKNMNSHFILKNILIASNWSHYFFSGTKPIVYEPIRLFFYLISRLYNPNKLAKKLDTIIQSASFKQSNYKAVYCGLYKNKEIFENFIYDQLIELEFEGNNFFCIKEYDRYLTQFYGDYKQLPPKEKRKTHHTFKVYNKCE